MHLTTVSNSSKQAPSPHAHLEGAKVIRSLVLCSAFGDQCVTLHLHVLNLDFKEGKVYFRIFTMELKGFFRPSHPQIN